MKSEKMFATPQPKHEIARGQNRLFGKAGKQNCGGKQAKSWVKILVKCLTSTQHHLKQLDTADKNNTWKAEKEKFWEYKFFVMYLDL